MKKLLLLLLPFLSFSQDKLYTADSTGKVYVVFVTKDSIGQVYQGNHTTFTSDGIFAKNLSSFNLRFKGFSKLNIKSNESELIDKPSTVYPEVPVPVDTIRPPSIETAIFPVDNYENPRYWTEAYTWNKVPSERATIKGMDGYDFSAIVANQKSFYEYGEWKQEYVSIGQKDVWNDNGKYFLKPKGYKTDTKTHLWDFDLKFPNFKLPKNKIVVIQATPKREIGVYNYLKKGVSYVKDKNDSDGYVFVSDGWLIDLGCPYAYDSRPDAKEIFDKWCVEVDENKLLESFINNVYHPNKDKGYVMLNWEHVGTRWNVRKDKIMRCLEYWQNNPHTAKMALWTVSGVSMGKPIFQGFGVDFSDALRFSGDIDTFRNKFGSFISADDSYSKYVEISQIGGYMNYPIDDGVIHHYLFEYLLNKKFYPNKQVLATTWFDQELINNFDLGRVKVENDDVIYLAQVKPKVFPSVAFNWGVWSIMGDGIDMWSDPNYWTEDKRYWGWGATDLSGNQLPIKHDEVGAKYPAQSMKSIDWVMAGVWAMSENKDIIEYNSEWKFVTLPTKSYHEKSVLIAYKIKGNEALVLGFDGFCGADEVKEHRFSINNNNYKIKTHGRYTSVVRINL